MQHQSVGSSEIPRGIHFLLPRLTDARTRDRRGRAFIHLWDVQKLPDTLAPFFQQVAPYAQVDRKVEPAFVEHQAEESIPRRHGRWRVVMPGDGSHPHFERLHQFQTAS